MRFLLSIPVLFGTLAWAEVRSVSLANPLDALGEKEIVTCLKTVAEVPTASVEAGRVTMEGNAGQLGRGEWLVRQFDHAADWQPSQQERDNPATREYGGEIRVYFLANTPTPQGMQETITILRTVMDVQRIFNYSRLHAIVWRGTQTQMEGVEWVLQHVDVAKGAARTDSGPFGYRDGPGSADTLEVFALPDDITPKHIQEMMITLRSRPISLMKIFPRTDPPAFVVRATAAQVDQVGREVTSVRNARGQQ